MAMYDILTVDAIGVKRDQPSVRKMYQWSDNMMIKLSWFAFALTTTHLMVLGETNDWNYEMEKQTVVN